ncbi:MAG: enamine deaminase RidA [Rhizobiales bacterium PAR1]|nr:MAG: enamine deaminase RidA [Rhizobiales bacterium PAR1]
MPKAVNPRSITPPASRYAQGIVHSARARRLITAGQVGATLDGRVVEGFAAQTEQAWDNIEAILAEAGMAITDLIRITVFVTAPGMVSTWRTIRDRRLGGHLVAATYLEVAGLAAPDYLVEIEAEAVCEEPDLAFLEFEGAGDVSSAMTSGGAIAAPRER